MEIICSKQEAAQALEVLDSAIRRNEAVHNTFSKNKTVSSVRRVEAHVKLAAERLFLEQMRKAFGEPHRIGGY